MGRSWGFGAVSVALLMLVAACGAGGAAGGRSGSAGAGAAGSTPTGGASTGDTDLDACGLLHADQVSSALGEPAGASKTTKIFDTAECEWQPESGHNGTVTLDVGPWQGDPGIKPLHLGPAVSGVGDEAYDSGNTGLFARKGSRGLRIWVFSPSHGTVLDQEKQLATAILTRW